MILVFVDFMNSTEEIPEYKKYLKGLKIAAKVTDAPLHTHNISAYTHVFLDYGGLNLPGNSLFEMMNHELDELLEEYPSVEFVIISAFGRTYYEADLKNVSAPNLRFMNYFMDEKELLEIMTN